MAPGFFDFDQRLQRLSDIGDQLEAYALAVGFKIFRDDLNNVLYYRPGWQGGRPAYASVLMFKILVIQAQNNLSDDRTEFLINDRLSFMRFLGLNPYDKVLGAKTIWAFRERLTQAEAVEGLFVRFDKAIRQAGFIAMSGQNIAIATFGYKAHSSIDKRHWFIRKWGTQKRLTMMARCCATDYLINPILVAMFGLTAPIAPRRMNSGWRGPVTSHASITGNPRASRCPNTFTEAIPQNPDTARRSSMSLRFKSR